MGMFDKLKKNRVPERVQGAAMLFCPLPDCEKILEQIEELFRLAHGEGGNNITLRQDDMEIVFLALTPEGEGENAQYARGQLQGVAGCVYQSETSLVEIKRNLFYHLRQCKSLVHCGPHSGGIWGGRVFFAEGKRIFEQPCFHRAGTDSVCMAV